MQPSPLDDYQTIMQQLSQNAMLPQGAVASSGFTDPVMEAMRRRQGPPMSAKQRPGANPPLQPRPTAQGAAFNREAAFASDPQAAQYQSSPGSASPVWYNDTGQPQLSTQPRQASTALGGALAQMHGLTPNDTEIVHQMMQLDPSGKTALRYAQHASGQATRAEGLPAKNNLDEAKAGELYQQTAQRYSDLNAKGEGEKNYATDTQLQEERERSAVSQQEALARVNKGARPGHELSALPNSAPPPNPARGDYTAAGQAQIQAQQQHVAALNNFPQGNGAIMPANLQKQLLDLHGGDHAAAERTARILNWK